MINLDGVLFGNFRTSKPLFIIEFIDADLNRCFDSGRMKLQNPEILALKELGLKIKEEHGERLNFFLDFHGHSSVRNIFIHIYLRP